jgi:hypothetical protein
LSALGPIPISIDFSQQHNTPALRRVQQAIKQSERVPRLDEDFGIDRDDIKSMSLQAGFYFPCGVWLVRPFQGVPPGLQTHGLQGMCWHPGAVEALQYRFDCSYARGPKHFLFEATVPQDFPRQLDKIEYLKPFQIGLRLNLVDHRLTDDFKIPPVFAG